VPAITRVVQIDHGPIPTFIESAPSRLCRVSSGEAVLQYFRLLSEATESAPLQV